VGGRPGREGSPLERLASAVRSLACRPVGCRRDRRPRRRTSPRRSTACCKPAPDAVVVIDDGSRSPLSCIPIMRRIARSCVASAAAGRRRRWASGLGALPGNVELVTLCDADDAWNGRQVRSAGRGAAALPGRRSFPGGCWWWTPTACRRASAGDNSPPVRTPGQRCSRCCTPRTRSRRPASSCGAPRFRRRPFASPPAWPRTGTSGCAWPPAASASSMCPTRSCATAATPAG
jgi:hypothetical protein